MKERICTLVGLAGSCIATLCGGWDSGLKALVIFMVIDYLSGLIVAGVFHNSTKTESGALQSKAGLKGLFRKVMILACVLIATQLDIVIGSSYIRDAVIIGFMANEGISILENAGLMGIKFPQVLQNGIDILTTKADESEEK